MRVKVTVVVAMAAALIGVAAFAQVSPQKFPSKQIQGGAELYQINCSPCHGSRMLDPQGALGVRQSADEVIEGVRQ